MLIWEDRKREINEGEGEMKKGKREEGRRRKGGREGGKGMKRERRWWVLVHRYTYIIDQDLCKAWRTHTND